MRTLSNIAKTKLCITSNIAYQFVLGCLGAQNISVVRIWTSVASNEYIHEALASSTLILLQTHMRSILHIYEEYMTRIYAYHASLQPKVSICSVLVPRILPSVDSLGL